MYWRKQEKFGGGILASKSRGAGGGGNGRIQELQGCWVLSLHLSAPLPSVLASPSGSLSLCCVRWLLAALVSCQLSNPRGKRVSWSGVLVKVWG